MFEHTSRYYAIETDTLNLANGKKVAFKRRRFLPDAANMQTLVEVSVVQGDRLDLITARTLGDPEQFWYICDANTVLNPLDLEEPGRVIRIPVPQFEG